MCILIVFFVKCLRTNILPYIMIAFLQGELDIAIFCRHAWMLIGQVVVLQLAFGEILCSSRLLEIMYALFIFEARLTEWFTKFIEEHFR